jgi:catalase
MPSLGLRSLVYDEATTLAGKNNNFQRIDLYNNIEAGNYPSWELAVQMFPDDGTYMWKGYDLLIPTQIVPFEVNEPVKLGKLTLNRNFQNFFAEPEAIAFSPSNVVNGISWVPDPLLQWRLMSYDDTASHRHGSPNSYQLPVNRPIAPVNNNYRDGYMQNYIFEGDQTSTPEDIGGVVEPGPNATLKYATGDEGAGRGPIGRYTSVFEWFAQARTFWGTLDIYAQQSTVDAYRFELGNVGDAVVVQRYIDESLNPIDNCLARRVAYGIGATLPAVGSGPRTNLTNSTTPYPSLYALNPGQQQNLSLAGLSIAVVANDTLLSKQSAQTAMQALAAQNASLTVIAPRAGTLATGVNATSSYTLTSSVFYDAVLIGDISVAGPTSYQSLQNASASAAQTEANTMEMAQFVLQAYGHQKPIGAFGQSGSAMLTALNIVGEPGVYSGSARAVTEDVITALMGPVRFPQRFPTDDLDTICA